MGFNLREYLMIGFRDSVGKKADYQIIEDSTGWMKKNVLEEKDLAELQGMIVEKNTPKPVEVVESIEEESTENKTEGGEIEAESNPS